MKPFVRVFLFLLCAPFAAHAQTTPEPPAPKTNAPEAITASVEAPEIVITVTESANLRTVADQKGYDGHSSATYLFVVPAKTNILGKQGGGPGIDTGKWPEGVSLVLLVRGNVYGGGGNGGDGGDTPMMRDGTRGGDAIYVQAPIGIAITKGGSVKAGGGGGAGADGIGSGGGGGFPNGKGGEGGSALQGDGGTIVAGGEDLTFGTPGYYYAPTLIDKTTPDMEINKEEVFGPVASVIRVKDLEEAISVANDTEMGLSAGICTKSLKAAETFKRRVQAGMVMVNLPTAGVDYHVPFGGRKGSSYGPREQGAYAKEFYTIVKTAYQFAG